MKKGLASFFLLMVMLASLVLLAGCQNRTGGDTPATVEYESPYDWEYTPEFTDSYDEDMNVDGQLDEAVWTTSDRKWMTFSEGDVTVWHTAYFTEKGLYIASRAQDTNFVWNARFNYSFNAGDKALNSAFAYVIADTNATSLQMFSMFDFAVDTHNRCSYEQTRFAAKAVTDQPIESGNATEMTAELFVSWDALNIQVDPETGMPESIRIIPYYRHIGSLTDTTQNQWISFLYANRSRLHCYAVFDKDGYASADTADSVWGNSATGISRSAGWDLSRNAEGIVTTNAAHSQAIFLRDSWTCSDRYVFSVTMRADGGIKGVDGSDGWFRGGICNASSSTDLIAMYLNGNSLKQGKVSFARLRPYDWKFTDNVASATLDGYDYEASDATVRLTVIKDGAYFYYIVEDQLIHIAYEPTLAGKTFPGVYTLSSQATFSDPEFTDYAGYETELKALLEQYVYCVETPASVRGGTLTAGTVGVDKTNANPTVSVLINPEQGYVLTDFTVNGESLIEGIDSLEWIRAHISSNRIDLPLDSSVTLGATFTRFDNMGDLITLRGDVTAPDGVTRLAGGTVVVYDTADPLFSYTVTTNALGRFEVSFLRPQEGGYELGGRTFTPGDSWRVAFSSSEGYPPVYMNFTLADADENGLIARSFTVQGKINMTYLMGSAATTDRVWNDDGSFTITARANTSFAGLLEASANIRDGAFLVETDIKLLEKGTDTWGLNQWNTYGIAVQFSGGRSLILGASLRGGNIFKVGVLPNGGWRCELEPNGDATAVANLRSSYTKSATLNVKVMYNAGYWSVLFNDVLYGTYSSSDLGVADYGTPVYAGFGCRLDDSLPQSATFASVICACDGDETFRTVGEQLGLYKTVSLPEGVTATANGQPVADGDKLFVGTEITLSGEGTDAHAFVVNGSMLDTSHDGSICTATFAITDDTEVALSETRTYTINCTFSPVGHSTDASLVTLLLNGVQKKLDGNSFVAPTGSKVMFSHPDYMPVSVTTGTDTDLTVSFTRAKVSTTNATYDAESRSLTLNGSWKLAQILSPAGADFAVQLEIDPQNITAWLTYGIGIQADDYFSLGFSRRHNDYISAKYTWGFVSPSKKDWYTGLFSLSPYTDNLTELAEQLAAKTLDHVTLTYVYHSDTGLLDAYVNGILVINFLTGLSGDATAVYLISTDASTTYLDWNFGVAGSDAYTSILASIGAED